MVTITRLAHFTLHNVMTRKVFSRGGICIWIQPMGMGFDSFLELVVHARRHGRFLGKVRPLPTNLWLGWDGKAKTSTRVGVSFLVIVVLVYRLLLCGSRLSLSLKCAHHCGRIMMMMMMSHEDS
jgi:hypothetical protein